MRTDWKSAVRSTYDAQANEYSRRHGMQAANLAHLTERILAQHPILGRVLDIGAGSGAALSDFVEYDDQPHVLVCTDISRETLLARTHSGSFDELLVQGDAEALPFARGSFDLVYANSVLHWLRVESGLDGFQNALREVVRVTRPDGIIGASIAGTGTASRFLKAYRAVLSRLAQAGRLASDMPDDPIGAMDLNVVVDAVTAGGGQILEAELVYEPVVYNLASDYVLDAAAYGYETFLGPIAPEQRGEVWQQIADIFTSDVGSGPYSHDQYMIYVIARPVVRS